MQRPPPTRVASQVNVTGNVTRLVDKLLLLLSSSSQFARRYRLRLCSSRVISRSIACVEGVQILGVVFGRLHLRRRWLCRFRRLYSIRNCNFDVGAETHVGLLSLVHDVDRLVAAHWERLLQILFNGPLLHLFLHLYAV